MRRHYTPPAPETRNPGATSPCLPDNAIFAYPARPLNCRTREYVEEEYAAELIAGSPEGVGYLLKDRVADVSEFLDSVRRVEEGGTALDPEVVAQLVARSRRRDPLDRLIAREREVLGLMAEGRSNCGIAQALMLSNGAVEKHISNILTKLDLPTSAGDNRRVLAVLRYLEA